MMDSKTFDKISRIEVPTLIMTGLSFLLIFLGIPIVASFGGHATFTEVAKYS